jgi:PKD repeat protein
MRGGFTLLSLALAATLILSGCTSKSDTSTSATGTSDTSSSGTGTNGSGASGSGTSSSSGAPSSTSSGARANAAPVINVFSVNKTAGAAPLKVSFKVNATDANKDALTYVLAFGDKTSNSTGSLPTGNVTHTFTAAGNYTVKLVVSDGKLAANQTVVIKVAASGSSASGGPSTTYTCHTAAGDATPSVPVVGSVGVSGGTPAGNIGGCSLTDNSVGGTVTAESGCDPQYDSNGDNQSDGEAAVGTKIEAGWSITAFCKLGDANVDSSITIA